MTDRLMRVAFQPVVGCVINQRFPAGEDLPPGWYADERQAYTVAGLEWDGGHDGGRSVTVSVGNPLVDGKETERQGEGLVVGQLEAVSGFEITSSEPRPRRLRRSAAAAQTDAGS